MFYLRYLCLLAYSVFLFVFLVYHMLPGSLGCPFGIL